MTLSAFKKIIWNHYRKHKRDFPWRRTRDPYRVLVSEIMLQQTQAPRVVEKYQSFIKRFPDFDSLARSSVSSVLREWQGLGYNRRGLALKKAAETVMKDHSGTLPRSYEALLGLPGIGPATAGDILAFAWNKPKAIIETNIRTVFIHCFFNDRQGIHDRDIMPLIEKTLDRANPREWYYALMDYGAMLKRTVPNPSRRSRHYARQSAFKGSNRELRSKLLKYLLAYGRQRTEIILEAVDAPKEIILKNLQAMASEGLIAEKKTRAAVFYFVP